MHQTTLSTQNLPEDILTPCENYQNLCQKISTKYLLRMVTLIRRSHRFWSGIFTDQTNEQVLMRNLKAPGGLAHGRGVTESMQAKFVHAIPRCIPICNALEDFCGVHSVSSDQHRDLRAATKAKDGEHCSDFYGWLSQHSPFQYPDVDGLVDLSTGIVADKSANAHKAYEMGLKVAESITGMTFSDVKLKSVDGVISIKAASYRQNQSQGSRGGI